MNDPTELDLALDEADSILMRNITHTSGTGSMCFMLCLMVFGGFVVLSFGQGFCYLIGSILFDLSWTEEIMWGLFWLMVAVVIVLATIGVGFFLAVPFVRKKHTDFHRKTKTTCSAAPETQEDNGNAGRTD